MNILPKKSWHVRNKDNVARVRRDEAAAEVERRKRDARALRAEQEVRTELLRKRARVGGRSPSPETPPVLFPPPHEAPNREHEAEKRREQERREKALGLLTFLGQSAAEAQSAPPWYLRPPPRGGEGRPGAGEGRPEVGEGRKALLDPLQAMGEGRRKALPPKTEPRSSPGPSPRRSGAGLAELRQQRLAREASEAARSRELLGEPRNHPKFTQNHPEFTQNHPESAQNHAESAQNHPESAQKSPKSPQNLSRERRRRYNSQFHPELGRGGYRDPRK